MNQISVNEDHVLWTEKYRPVTIDQVILPNRIKKVLNQVVSDKKLKQHLLLDGSAGSGKCVTKDSMVLVEGKGLCRISDFSSGAEGFTDDEINVYNGDEIETTSHFYEEDGTNLIRIENSYGYEVTGTQEHPMQCLNTKTMELEFVKLKDITTEHYTVVQTNTNIYGDYQPFSYVPRYSKFANNTKKVNHVPYMLDETVATLYGYIVANGSVYKDIITISTHNERMQKHIVELTQQFGEGLSKVMTNGRGVSLTTDLSRMLLTEYETATGRYKKTPRKLLQSPKSVQVAYLRALIDCDGYMAKQDMLEFYTASKDVALEVSNMLNNMGIFNQRKRKHGAKCGDVVYDHTYHTLTISSSDLDLYRDMIGSDKYTFTHGKKRNTNIKLLPRATEYITECLDKLRIDLGVNVAGSYHTKEGEYKRFSYIHGSMQIITSLDGSINDYIDRLKCDEFDMQDLTKLNDICVKGRLFSRVVKIESAPDERVYDFTLPHTHKFWCNSMISHNTTCALSICSELDADYLMINASLEASIDTLRTKVTQFASSMSLNGRNKIVILDEIDGAGGATGGFQPALRGIMEKFAKNAQFILTCNNKSRLIDAIHSRCSIIDFHFDAKEKKEVLIDICKRMFAMLDHEGIKHDKKVVGQVVAMYYPDTRKTINELQKYSAHGEIDVGILANTGEVDLDQLFKALKTKDFGGMRKWVASHADVDAPTIMRKIYDGMFDKLNPNSIPPVILLIAEYQYKAALVADQEINMVAMLTEIMGGAEWRA